MVHKEIGCQKEIQRSEWSVVSCQLSVVLLPITHYQQQKEFKMLLSRISVVSFLMLSLGGFVTLASPNPLFPQTLAQSPQGLRRAERGPLKWMDQLNLTDQQKQKLLAVQSQYKDQISQRQQAVRQANKELREMMTGNTPTDKIRRQHKQVQFLRQQVEDSRLESMLAIREVLTQEQRSKLGQLMEQRQQNSRKQK
ncbi:MAG: Spy/CpxP family protein refolding chaperone [Potamolinea sp.]